MPVGNGESVSYITENEPRSGSRRRTNRVSGVASEGWTGPSAAVNCGAVPMVRAACVDSGPAGVGGRCDDVFPAWWSWGEHPGAGFVFEDDNGGFGAM